MGVIERDLGMGKVIIRLCLYGGILVLAPSEQEGLPVKSVGPPVGAWRPWPHAPTQFTCFIVESIN
jgi:hypothetical protein